MAADIKDSALGITLCSSFLGFSTHAGFLAGLQESVALRHLAGASSGAMVAGLAAAGVSPQQMVEIFASQEFRHAFLEIGHILSVPFRRLLGRPTSGLSTGKRVIALLREIVGNRRIEDCQSAQLAVAVTNLTLGRTEIRQAGPLAETILASCAYPTMVAQQKLGDEVCWDGGIANDGPFGHWLGQGPVTTILVHSVGQPSHRLATGRIGIRQGFHRSLDAVGAEFFRLRNELAKLHGQSVLRWNTATPRPMLMISAAAVRENFAAGQEMGRKAAASLQVKASVG